MSDSPIHEILNSNISRLGVEITSTNLRLTRRLIECCRWGSKVGRKLKEDGRSSQFPSTTIVFYGRDNIVNVASKLYGVNATIIILVFVLYCIVENPSSRYYIEPVSLVMGGLVCG